MKKVLSEDFLDFIEASRRNILYISKRHNLSKNSILVVILKKISSLVKINLICSINL